MPFTISHAAAALPLQRYGGRELPLLALAVGSMSPDLEFFIVGRIERTIGHTAHGVLLLDLPLSLLFLATMTWLLVPGVVALLPDRYRHLEPAIERSFSLRRSQLLTPAGLATTSIAVMVGAGSHILWDVFTHGPAQSDTVLEWLNSFPFSVGKANFALYSILQWISTGVGLAVITNALIDWIERQPAQPAKDGATPQPRRRTMGLALVALITTAFAVQSPVALIGDRPARASGLGEQITTSAIWAMSGCVIALGLVGLAARLGTFTEPAGPPETR